MKTFNSGISWTHMNISLSRRTCEFWKVHRIIRCFNSLLKGLLGFCDFEFSRSQLINIHEQIGTREKSPDNRIVRIIEVRIIEVQLYCIPTNVTQIDHFSLCFSDRKYNSLTFHWLLQTSKIFPDCWQIPWLFADLQKVKKLLLNTAILSLISLSNFHVPWKFWKQDSTVSSFFFFFSFLFIGLSCWDLPYCSTTRGIKQNEDFTHRDFLRNLLLPFEPHVPVCILPRPYVPFFLMFSTCTQLSPTS